MRRVVAYLFLLVGLGFSITAVVGLVHGNTSASIGALAGATLAFFGIRAVLT